MTTLTTLTTPEALASIDAAEIRCGPELAAAVAEARNHLASRIAELEGELAAVRVDAERYRWLRDAHLDDAVDPHRWGDAYSALGEPLPAERIDAAIDAAREGK